LTEKWRWKGSVEKLIEYWFESGAKPHYKLMDYLAGLRAAGIKLYLSTQNEKYQTANFIKKLKPLMKYDGVITTCEVGYKKSNPKFFGEALKITGVKAENAIVIDNNQKAIAAAELCGIKTVFFENESQSIAALGAILE
jgi:putative hydrolase of the HAD superfamily